MGEIQVRSIKGVQAGSVTLGHNEVYFFLLFLWGTLQNREGVQVKGDEVKEVRQNQVKDKRVKTAVDTVRASRSSITHRCLDSWCVS